VEGLIPVADGDIPTDSGLIPDTLTISGDTITYTPLDGYISPTDEPTIFGYTVTDDNINAVFGLPENENLSVTVTNNLPTGAITLDDASMNASGETLGVVSGSFTDADGDDVTIGNISPATDDYNKTFGGTLTYDGDVEGTYNYTADAALPGYVGEDDFVAQLSDGQKTYYIDGHSENVYGSGTIDLTVVNELPTGAIVLEDAPMNADGETLGVVSGSFTDADGDDVVIGDITAATDDYNKTFGGTLTYDGDVAGTYNYTADATLPGYVGEDDFVAQLSDGQKNYVFKQVDGVWVVDTENTTDVYGSGTIDLTIVNELPTGAIILEDAPMNADGETLGVVSGAFTDDDGDDFIINSITKATDDDNKGFGGTLDYNGDNTPYNDDIDDTYDYTADAALPGYVGEDDFDVELWDGQIDYTFIEVDGVWSVDTATNVYGSGTIDLETTNELPEGDAWFGQVHMDSQDVGPRNLEVDFGAGVNVSSDTYTGSVIGSDNYGGTLVYDGDTWTYSTDPTLPGYVGDDNDEFGQGGYVADDLFTVNLSSDLGQQYEYQFGGENPGGEWEVWIPESPDGTIYRRTVSAQGTVSVDITNALPTIDGTPTIEHMNESIENQVFATDHLDGNPINELDALSISDTTNPGFGGLTLIDNGDGTYSYTYDPAEGFVGNDSFEITVYDGQRDYVFVDGEIQSNDLVPVSGTVNMKITNILPTGNGDLGTFESGTTTVISQNGTDNPVLVIDTPDLPQQNLPDTLTIPDGTYPGSGGGTLTFANGEWTYTPAPGFTGEETFVINVSDGERYYYNIEEWDQVYGKAEVTMTVESTPPVVPAVPLPLLEIPELKGCPAVMEAAAIELAVNSDELQLLIANSMATNPNLQPCTACENLLTAAAALKGINPEMMAAMNAIFNTLAPIDAPFDQTVVASIQTAFANFREMKPQLAAMSAEEYEQYQQYAMTDEVVEAFVSYVAVLDNDLKLPVGDAMALVMDKYFGPIETSENPNIGAYILEQIQAAQAVSEPIVASAD
ncbi:MAG: Ig-like domain-containing protein, partial [Planctomycetota bacterium]